MSSLDEPDQSRSGPPRDVTDELATRLLHLGMDEETPVDHLVTRLTLPDGPQWFEEALSTPSIRDGERLRVGPCLHQELLDLKDRSKSLLSHAGNSTEEAIAILGYLLAQAAHLVHHDAPLSASLPEEVSQAFDDLAAIAPSPWNDFFRAARTKI